MHARTIMRARGRALPIAVAAAAAMGLAQPHAGAAEHAAKPSCGQAGSATASAASARRSTLCLINAERARRGLPRLRYHRALGSSATRHARDMVRRHYFAHRSPEGRSLRDRVAGSAYVRRARRRWRVGENLAWGRGRAGAPQAVMRAWLRSRSHRRLILSRRFRHLGVAIVRDAPRPGTAGVTYVVHFGAR